MSLLGSCTTSQVDSPSAAVGADHDGHGCIGSAGYSWCQSTQRCERPWVLAGQKGFPVTEAHFARYCSTGVAN
nr:hypothetical protein [Caballeronia arvi]